MKRDDLLEKQVDFISSEFEKKIKEVTDKCVELDGVVEANAIAISMAKSFAATAAIVTMNMSKNDTKFLLNGFYKMIESTVFEIKEEFEEDTLKN